MEDISWRLIGQLTQEKLLIGWHWGQASLWFLALTNMEMWHDWTLLPVMFYPCNGQNAPGWWILQCHFVQALPTEQLMQAVFTLCSHSLNIGPSSGYIRARGQAGKHAEGDRGYMGYNKTAFYHYWSSVKGIMLCMLLQRLQTNTKDELLKVYRLSSLSLNPRYIKFSK